MFKWIRKLRAKPKVPTEVPTMMEAKAVMEYGFKRYTDLLLEDHLPGSKLKEDVDHVARSAYYAGYFHGRFGQPCQKKSNGD